jgi:Flp pilus assembly protein TadD
MTACLGALVLSVGAIGGLHLVKARREAEIRRALDQARVERKDGRVATASRRLEELNRARPDRADVLMELGLAEAARGRLNAARAAWERIPAQSLEGPTAAAARAGLDILEGHFERAEKLLVDALKTAPANAPGRVEARDALVRLLRSEGREVEARHIYLEGIRETTDPPAFLRRLAQIDREPFATEGARTYLENAARAAPDDRGVRLGQAHLALRLGDLVEADQRLKGLEAERPEDEAVARLRLDWARAAGRDDVGLDAATRVRAANQAEPWALYAWVASVRGDTGAESAALKTALIAGWADPAVLARLAELAAAAGRVEEASDWREKRRKAESTWVAYDRALRAIRTPMDAIEPSALANVLGLRFESEVLQAHAFGGPRPSPPSWQGRLGEQRANLVRRTSIAPRPVASSAPVVPTIQFEDITASARIDFIHDKGDPGDRKLTPPITSCGGVALFDFNGDGRLDIYAVQGGPFPPGPATNGGDRLYQDRGDGTFEDVSESSGIARIVSGYGHGAAVGDIDNDGHPDLFLTRWRAYQLLRNRGDGTFEDVTEPTGLSGDRDWPTSAAFADLDNDGDLDLYVCHYLKWDQDDLRSCVDRANPAVFRCQPRDFPAMPDHLFRNDNGRFVDVTAEAGVDDREGRSLGVVAADLDGDLLVDLFVANDTTANFLWHNRGAMKFEEVAATWGVAANASGGFQAGMGAAAADLDGDGRIDLAVTNFYNESTTFFRNLAPGVFADRTAAIGLAVPSRARLGFGLVLADLNNDGRVDVLTANGHVSDGRPLFPWKMPLQVLAQGADGLMRDVSAGAGPAFAVPRLARGLAVGDLDDDGRLDAVALDQDAPLAVLRNTSDPSTPGLTIKLEGTQSNRDAVGAVATVTLADGSKQVLARVGGGSFQSASDGRLHVGLGAGAGRVDEVEVRWPSGRVERFGRLESGRAHRLREGEGVVVTVSGPPSLPSDSIPDER